MSQFYDLNIQGSEVQLRLDLASHNVLAFDGILDVPVVASEALITEAGTYKIVYAPNGGRGEMLLSMGGVYYRHFKLQSEGKTVLDSSWYNTDGQIRRDRLFLNGAARDIYAYAAGAFGKVERDGVDGITPHIDPVTRHWMIGEADTGILARGTDGESAYELWVEQPGNEGKTLNEFLASLKESGFVSKAVQSLPTGSNIEENTIYAVPEKSDQTLTDPDMWAEYIRNGNSWVLMARHDESGLSELIATTPQIKTSPIDLSIEDDNGIPIAQFANGHFKTKKFNSEQVPTISYMLGITESIREEIPDANNFPLIDESIEDFSIKDENGNALVRFLGGHIKTKYFDSRKALIKKEENATSNSILAFVAKMNEYANDFGMNNTHFLNASGQNQSGHYSCAKDIMKMCAACTAYEKLMRFWGQESYSVSVGGENARTITGVSSYVGSNMTSVGNYYHIFGGKSGTWNFGGSIGKLMNLTLAVKSNVDDEWLIGCIIRSKNNDRGVPFKQLLDWLEDYRNGNVGTTPTIEAYYAAAGVLPKGNPMAYADIDWMMVGKDAQTQYAPASMTKLMTAMIALDYCSLDEIMTIKASDIQTGSGDTFYNGDTISVRDALLAMLLPSSNTLAVAFSRFVGNKILNIKNN